MPKKSSSAPVKPLVDIALDGYRWTDLQNPTFAALDQLKRRHPSFQETDLRDCLPPFQRPKLIERDDYLFAVLLFPVYDRDTGIIKSTEIDFFVGRDFAVTSHAPELKIVADAASRAGRDAGFRSERLAGSPGRLLDMLLHDLVAYCFPMLTHLSADIDAIEAGLFKDADDGVIREILRVKTNIANFRKIMQGHSAVLRKLLERAPRFFEPGSLAGNYRDLADHLNEIWDALENYKDAIDALHESHISLVTYRTSRTSERLAALALVILPTTLMATIFSMRAENVPFLGHGKDFWLMLGVVLTVMFSTAALLKSKKWL
ncbi:magnesium transporter CorA family protein [Candidatus Uhrbacteria bacterium]|nr:magnesium transporter CorA family protein [Candidatus Uhrbacteria bacterium]